MVGLHQSMKLQADINTHNWIVLTYQVVNASRHSTVEGGEVRQILQDKKRKKKK